MHTQTYFDLLDSFPKRGCAVCHLVLDHARRFIDTILYEAVLDSKVRTAVRARRGFCNEHSWQLTQFHGVQLGAALLYEAVLDEVLGEMAHISSEPVAQSALGRWRGDHRLAQNVAVGEKLAARAGCLVCESMVRAEKRVVETLSETIAEADMQNAYRGSDGLCLPHFRLLLELTRSGDDLALLVAIQKGIWLKLHAELKELIRKSDPQYGDEERGEEMGSWRRALRQMAGEEGMFGVDR